MKWAEMDAALRVREAQPANTWRKRSCCWCLISICKCARSLHTPLTTALGTGAGEQVKKRA